MLGVALIRAAKTCASGGRRGRRSRRRARRRRRGRASGRRSRRGRRRASPTGCERSVKIKLKIKKTDFENKSNTILKIKDLAAKIK